MARTGLADIRDELRGMTAAGTADWTQGTALTYFSDDMLDDILDRHAYTFTYEQMELEEPSRVGSSYEWTVYELPYQHIEASTGGTAIFTIQDNVGTVVTNYTANYRTGYFTFDANTNGVPYFATGSYYDINAAAAEIWMLKADHVAASAFDFSTDNHTINRSQIFKTYMERAAFYQAKAWDGSGYGSMIREDTDVA